MSTVLLAEVNLPMITGLPRDVAINSLHFLVGTGVDIDDTVMDDIGEACHQLYTYTVSASGEAWDGLNIRNFMSPMLDGGENRAKVKFYDAQAAVGHKVLLGERQFTLGAASSAAPLTNELAVCASLTCANIGGVPIRRRRGRVYIGPLNADAVGARTSAGEARYPAVTTSCRHVIALACEQLATALTAPYSWAVYSPTNHEAYVINGGYVDNDLDIQRRRQVDADARTTWGMAP